FKQIEFLNLSNKRVLAILVTENGGVQNCVLYVEREFSESELTEAANFFNARFAGKAVSFVRRELLQGMQSDREQMDEIMRTAIEIGSGLLKQPGDDKNKIYVSGESNLMDSPDLAEMEKLRRIFDTFKTKNDLLELLDKSSHASGVSIFIGDESGYNAFEDCSVITAPYETDDRCIGVLGVIGPTRMAYQDVIPIVDVTARLLSSALMGDGSRLN
ncbi:MAG: HrcA family transcriptional regulator, partial [Arenicellales bacterium WSBS_2016_MAG_OTU3]